jgi:hypothetical protein
MTTGQIVRVLTGVDKRLERLESWGGGVSGRGVRVYRSTAQALAKNVLTPIAFSHALVNHQAAWSSGQPTRLYARSAGFYMAGGQGSIDSGAFSSNGYFLVAIRRNGDNYLAQNEIYNSSGRRIALAAVTGLFWMDEGDYIEVVARQNTGAASMNLWAATAQNQQFNHGWLMRCG